MSGGLRCPPFEQPGTVLQAISYQAKKQNFINSNCGNTTPTYMLPDESRVFRNQTRQTRPARGRVRALWLIQLPLAQALLYVAFEDGACAPVRSSVFETLLWSNCSRFLFSMEPRRFAICLAIGISFFFASVAVYLLTAETYWRTKVGLTVTYIFLII